MRGTGGCLQAEPTRLHSVLPVPTVTPCAAPSRPARVMSGFWTRQVQSLGDGLLFSSQDRRAAVVLAITRFSTARRVPPIGLIFLRSSFQRLLQDSCLRSFGGRIREACSGRRTPPCSRLASPRPTPLHHPAPLTHLAMLRPAPPVVYQGFGPCKWIQQVKYARASDGFSKTAVFGILAVVAKSGGSSGESRIRN